jgi:hypothetical protein
MFLGGWELLWSLFVICVKSSTKQLCSCEDPSSTSTFTLHRRSLLERLGLWLELRHHFSNSLALTQPLAYHFVAATSQIIIKLL